MKRLGLGITILLLVVAVAIAGCGRSSNNGGSASTPTQSAAPSPSPSASAGQEPAKTVNYPTKPIEIVVPFAAGGGTDAVARTLAESLKNVLGQDVVVVNKTGGGGAVGMNEGLNAKADGYTLTLVTREVVSLPLMGLAPFQASDFKYVAQVNEDPIVMVVSSKSKYNTLDDLLAELKANPGKLTFAAAAVPNFHSIPFAEAAGVEFNTVPFQGAAPAIVEILGGRADFGLYSPGEVKQYVESGELRAIAVMSEERYSGLPDVPTLTEKGINALSMTYRGVAVPPDTPDEIVQILEEAVAKVMEDPQFIEFMNKSFLGVKYRNSADFTQLIEKDTDILKPVIEIAKQQQ